MKRSFIWIIVLIFTFFVGVTLTVFWVRNNPPIVSYEEAISKGVPDVEYCQLRNNPYEYNGKVVRVSANLHWFMHGYYLHEINCSDTKGGNRTDEARTAITVYDKNRTEVFEYLQNYHEPGKLWQPLKIIAVGRFRYKIPDGYSDGIDDRTSFHFEIYKIESAKR
jgi:hypothetical protein